MTTTHKESKPTALELVAAYAKWLKEGGKKPDLFQANLRGADLRDADLRDADLRGSTGWIPLTQADHGYLVAASWHGIQWRIQAGCRDFTVSEARAHWGAPDYHSPSSGSCILHMLDWLEKQPTPAVDEAEVPS